MALKLDMAKAYDRVERIYIQQLLLKMGFHETFVTWIMLCITTPTYKFNINGQIAGEVIPTRGLRQGDPLSPYLFLICAEGLSRLLNHAECQRDIQGLSLVRGGLTKVNLDKSTIIFSKNTLESDKDGIIAELGQLQRNNLGFYLGLPAVVGRSKKKMLEFIKDRIAYAKRLLLFFLISGGGKMRTGGKCILKNGKIFV
uniref:Reverse transcriptase domain-containing protein n=1 Tax=Nicotiana tabacum TaxID=4097 RepID=A0A1S3X1S2_TOBAC|nr:PREDICTED: uncharacterized protein LOC107760407 [Nicotiana tabacum]